ncbi:MAG: 30S ribosomal protein S8 [Nanoarchaeota archaeon]|nr:30S ribosomal protein S8 [Nanoarchaeota archaeon]
MSQDIVADALNQIMNAKRVEKKQVVVGRKSKFLINLLGMMKKMEYIDFTENEDGRTVTISILKLNICRAVKPRYFVSSDNIEKYLRRFLPSRKFGKLIVSTNKGLMDQHEMITNKTGGALIAYVY